MDGGHTAAVCNLPAAGFTVDISSSQVSSDDWLRLLLASRYTLGVEAGASLLDRNGSVFERSNEYRATHPDATFEEIEAACFPGLDGNLDYRALAPRQLDAVMTRTCQVLTEGEYSHVLEPGKHYIELQKDFANIDQVLELMKREDLRERMVDRAYRDIVDSGRYNYRVFATTVLTESLAGLQRSARFSAPRILSPRVVRNRFEEFLSRYLSKIARQRLSNTIRASVRPLLSSALGEERLRALLTLVRRGQQRS